MSSSQRKITKYTEKYKKYGPFKEKKFDRNIPEEAQKLEL